MSKPKEQIQSPPRPQRSGSKQLTENLSKDELLRRLKKITRELSDADQGDHIEDYHGTVTVLARPFILKHADKDVRCYAACCLAHVLRIHAPDAPYDKNQLWSIFDLIINQLEGLKHAKSIKGEKGTSYEKLFHLLETLSIVKTLILCVQLEFHDLIIKFFKNMFNSVREEHSKKVKNFMLDIMSSLLAEAEAVPQELLDIILENIVNPRKTSNKAAYELASGLIERTATSIEPHIQQFFNNALFFDKASESRLEDSLYDVLYELYNICPSILLSVLPQLEFKLKSVNKDERIPVAALLGKMFSDEESTLAQSHKPLWHCFLSRFVDIDTDVRIECTKHAKLFFLHHPELVAEITEKLIQRQRDPEQKVRMEVVTTICEAASENVNSVSQKLFDVVTERLRDRKFDVRKDTTLALGRLYKKMSAADVNVDEKKKVSWIPTKILHCYYQNSPEDRINVERVFLGCLVPISLSSKERMKRLFTLYQTLGEQAIKAFNHMLSSQASLRSDMNEILRLWEESQRSNPTEAKKLIAAKISAIARVLPEPSKSQEHLKSLVNMLSEKNLLKLMKTCLSSGQDCAKVTEAVREVVIKFGAKNPMYDTIKAILDRAAPLLIDTSAGKELVELVTKCLNGELFEDDMSSEEDSEEFDRGDITSRGLMALELLLTCVRLFPAEFKFTLIFENILMFLKKRNVLVDYALRILQHIGEGLEKIDSTLYSHYQQELIKILTKGNPSQVKLAARIVTNMYPNSSTIFQRILESRLESLDYGSSTLLNTLSCISEIALHAAVVFEPHHVTVITDFVFKELLVKDRGKTPKTGTLWCDKDDLSKDAKAKIFGLKILVNWLRGKINNDSESVQPVFAMLDKAIKQNGDITGGGCIRSCEMSHIKLVAACGLLKLAQVPAYHVYLEMKYFQRLTSVIKDSCTQVREKFATKLSKGLDSLKLPLEYLALFSFYGKETSKDIKQQAKYMILRNINIRNEYLKQHKIPPERTASLLPEYAMPYLIYMLSHLPNYDYTESEHLKGIKGYLWFFMECILTRGDNYNFMKKLAENIKHTKDANNQETESVNRAIYVVCDIVIGIIMGFSKTRTFLLKDYPANIALPKKLFLPLGKVDNSKSYLPKGFVVSPVKRTTSVAPRVTPTKGFIKTSSGSASRKKPSTSNTRVSEKSKGKKIQKSLLSMLEKKDDESDAEEISDIEEEKSPRNEKSKRKRGKNMPDAEEEVEEESFTKVSPRKKSKTSPTKKRETTAVTSGKEKQTKKSPGKILKEEQPTRFSPRRQRNPVVERNKIRTDLGEVQRNINEEADGKTPIDKRAKNSLDLSGEVKENENMQTRSDKSPKDDTVTVKKRMNREENNHENPTEQSSLIIKRKRKRR